MTRVPFPSLKALLHEEAQAQAQEEKEAEEQGRGEEIMHLAGLMIPLTL